MRKSIIDPAAYPPRSRSEQEWLDLEQVAKVEVISQDPNFPIESALASGKGLGWRAAGKGKQIIRIIFDKPRPLAGLDSSLRSRKGKPVESGTQPRLAIEAEARKESSD